MRNPTRSLLPYAVLIAALVASTPVWGGSSGGPRGDNLRIERGAKASKGGKSGKGGKSKGGKSGKGGKGKSGKGSKSKNDGVGPVKKKDYPTAERTRPLVLPNEMGEVGFDLGVGSAGGATSLSPSVSFDYGVEDVVDFGVSTGLALGLNGGGLGWNGLVLEGHGLAYDSKETDFAPGLVVPITFNNGLGLAAIVDLPARVVLPAGMFVRFGQGAIPVTLAPNFGLQLNANAGFGYQVNNKTAFFIDASLLSLLIAPDAGISGPWDNLSLALGGQYTPTRQWDAGGLLGLANQFGVDNGFGFALTGFGRYRF